MSDATHQHGLLYERSDLNLSGLQEYILTVGIAALIVGILTGLLDEKSSIGVIVRMICGLFLAVTVIKPVVNLNLEAALAYLDTFDTSGAGAAAYGDSLREEALRERIKQETEAYILDKAGLYQLDLIVEVTVADGDPPIPEAVRIKGNASVYARGKMREIMETELGIPKERQQWIG